MEYLKILEKGNLPLPGGRFSKEKATYFFLRSQGMPAKKAYLTIKRQGVAATLLALYLIEQHGYDRAVLLLKGAFEAPYGAERTASALGLPLQYLPKRRVGVGISAERFWALLEKIEKALSYVRCYAHKEKQVSSAS